MANNKGRLVQVSDTDSDVAIKVSKVSKSFRLPHNRQNTLKSAIVNFIGKGDRTFESQEVLKDISFEIKKGEFFGIVGRNGSGKSTLLKMLAGIYKPTKGDITVNGSLTPFIELGVGFNPELTGRENVYLNGALLGFNNTEMDLMYDDIVQFAELERFMDQKLKNYSSGMQVRLAFSIAIRAQSDILLLDEVLAVGDAAFQTKCLDYFYQLRESDTTVIFVSHDQGTLQRFCTRGVLIDQGKQLYEGPIQEVIKHYTPIVLDQMGEHSAAASPESEAPSDTKKESDIRLVGVVLQNSAGESVDKAVFGEKLSVRVEVEFIQDVKEPVLGITLWKKNVSEAIFAANNITEDIGKLGHIRAGKHMRYTVHLPDTLNNGEYSVEVAAANRAITVYYIQEKDACIFRIMGSHNPHALLAQIKPCMEIEK